jgi:hypothetical protein
MPEPNPVSAVTASPFALERSEAVPALIGRHEDFLFISGLGGTACDVGAVADGARMYTRSEAPWALPA